MKALIIIDMQEAYFKPPALARRKQRLVTRINQLADEFRASADLIVNVRTVHSRDKRTWTLNMLQDDQGFAFDGDDEALNVAGLRLDDATEVIKTRDSAFHGTNLLELLRSHTVESITLAGVSTHSCVFHTAAQAYAYDFPVRIAAAAVDDEDELLQHQALEYLRQEYRQDIA